MAVITWSSEEEFEDFICDHIDKTGLCPISKDHVTGYYRQLNLGKYGTADVVKYYADDCSITVTVLELKKDKVDLNTIGQVSRYMTAIKDLFKKHDKDNEIDVYGEVAAPSISQGDIEYIANFLTDINIYNVHLDMVDGFDARLFYGMYYPHEEFKHAEEFVLEAKEAREKEEIEFNKELEEYNKNKIVNITGDKND